MTAPGLSPSDLAFALGCILVGGLLLQLALMLFQGFRGAVHDRAVRAAGLRRLELEIRAARLRVESVEQDRAGWNGFRKFAVAKKVAECADTFSFYLEPHDRRPIPAFRPGQYLTFQLDMPFLSKPIVR